MIKYYRRLSLLLSLILSLTGCATSKLWSDENYDIYESTAVATGLEIYAENPLVLSKYDSPEVRIKYTGVKNAVDNNSLPPYHDGCIVLERFADSSGFLVGLESLLNATPKSKINSVKAVISHRSYDPAESYHLRLGLALQPVDNDLFDGIGKPKVNSSWSPMHSFITVPDIPTVPVIISPVNNSEMMGKVTPQKHTIKIPMKSRLLSRKSASRETTDVITISE